MMTVSICSEGGDSIVTASFIHLGPCQLLPLVRGPWPRPRRYGWRACGEIGSSPHREGFRARRWSGRLIGSAGGFRQRSRLDEPRPWEEAVLHGEQGGSGPGGDADLSVGVLDVAVGGLDRDAEP